MPRLRRRVQAGAPEAGGLLGDARACTVVGAYGEHRPAGVDDGGGTRRERGARARELAEDGLNGRHLHLDVGVEVQPWPALRRGVAQVHGGRLRPDGRLQHRYARVAAGDLGGAVGAAVADHDDVDLGRREKGEEAIERARDHAFLVVGRDDDGAGGSSARGAMWFDHSETCLFPGRRSMGSEKVEICGDQPGEVPQRKGHVFDRVPEQQAGVATDPHLGPASRRTPEPRTRWLA